MPSEGKARLNVYIDPELHRELRIRAAKNYTSLSATTEDALRLYLAEMDRNEQEGEQ